MLVSKGPATASRLLRLRLLFAGANGRCETGTPRVERPGRPFCFSRSAASNSTGGRHPSFECRSLLVVHLVEKSSDLPVGILEIQVLARVHLLRPGALSPTTNRTTAPGAADHF